MTSAPTRMPPGWYQDGFGVTRWWDGFSWTQHTAPRAVATTPPRILQGISSTTRWIWWIVLLPLVAVIPLAGYLIDVHRLMSSMIATAADLSSGDGGDPGAASEIITASVGLMFSPWTAVLVVVSWGSTALVVWFCYLDRRELIAREFAAPLHWAWALLGVIIYLVGRTMVVRRQTGGRGTAPLWVSIAIQAALFVAVVVWTVWLSVDIAYQILLHVPVG